MSDAVASQRIAAALAEEILGGRYRPGERIRQEELAARSGASRIPVREALRMLEADGLVTVVANSGAWVTRLTARELSETYLVRERLEPLLLAMSLPGLRQEQIARMGDLAAAMEAATGAPGEPDVDAFLRADREFHLSGYAGAQAGEAWRIVARMWNTTQHYRREFTQIAAGRETRPATGRPGWRSRTWSTGCCSTASGAAIPTTPSGCWSRTSAVPALSCCGTRRSSASARARRAPGFLT